MKKTIIASLLVLAGSLVLAQTANDRRGFQGIVTSELVQTMHHEGQKTTKEESAETTTIQFTSRQIIIGDETYDIIKKEFDGKSTTTFTCTKRRATFDIGFKAGTSVSVTDQSNKDLETVYLLLTEK